jgi:hypothetical protein
VLTWALSSIQCSTKDQPPTTPQETGWRCFSGGIDAIFQMDMTQPKQIGISYIFEYALDCFELNHTRASLIRRDDYPINSFIYNILIKISGVASDTGQIRAQFVLPIPKVHRLPHKLLSS